jgi:hypothetical protein
MTDRPTWCPEEVRCHSWHISRGTVLLIHSIIGLTENCRCLKLCRTSRLSHKVRVPYELKCQTSRKELHRCPIILPPISVRHQPTSVMIDRYRQSTQSAALGGRQRERA